MRVNPQRLVTFHVRDDENAAPAGESLRWRRGRILLRPRRPVFPQRVIEPDIIRIDDQHVRPPAFNILKALERRSRCRVRQKNGVGGKGFEHLRGKSPGAIIPAFPWLKKVCVRIPIRQLPLEEDESCPLGRLRQHGVNGYGKQGKRNGHRRDPTPPPPAYRRHADADQNAGCHVERNKERVPVRHIVTRRPEKVNQRQDHQHARKATFPSPQGYQSHEGREHQRRRVIETHVQETLSYERRQARHVHRRMAEPADRRRDQRFRQAGGPRIFQADDNPIKRAADQPKARPGGQHPPRRAPSDNLGQNPHTEDGQTDRRHQVIAEGHPIQEQ